MAWDARGGAKGPILAIRAESALPWCILMLSCYHTCMAQFVVRNIEDEVRDRLRSMAKRHGRSMEEEVREILRAAVASRPTGAARFGSRASARFRACGLETDIAELRGTHVEPPRLGR